MRCSVVFGVTSRLLVINISSSSPAINTATYYQRCVNLRDGGRPPATTFTTPTCCSVNTGSKPDIGSESRFLPTHLHSTPQLGGFLSEYCYAVWHGKTRMAWLPDTEKILMTCLFVYTTDERARQTDRQTPHDGTSRRVYAYCSIARQKPGLKPGVKLKLISALV